MTTEVFPQSDDSLADESCVVASDVADEVAAPVETNTHVADGVSSSQESVQDDKPKKKKAVAKPKEPKPPKEPKVKVAKKPAGRKSKDDELPPPTVIECTGQREWYILKVQVNRETSVRDTLLRRVAMAGMGPLFGEIVIPTEKVTEIRGDKKKVVERKLYPGYLMISMELTEESWYLVRETFGVSDFTSSGGKPSPMLSHEVEKMLVSTKETPEQPKLRVGYQIGDQIKVKDGTFETCEGTVENIDYASGRVTVIISLFGRSTPVELEYWQIESIS
ncbi:MAG: transcription termination/antitermination protein NusG [Thermoguttaceae bacterium]